MKKLNGSISWINVSIIPVVGFILLMAFLPLACKKNFPCDGCGFKGPVAEAGPDRVIVLPRDSVHLDGSLSHDSSGKITAYTWTKISGPSSLNIENETTAKPVLTSLVEGSYVFELEVKNDKQAIGIDSVQITVKETNGPPVAKAGLPQTIVLPLNHVILDGSGSFDLDNDIARYEWTKISGPSSFTITTPYDIQPEVTGLVLGTYLFELHVTDSDALSSYDTVKIIVAPGCNPGSRPEIFMHFVPIGYLSQARYLAVGAYAGNKILFAGGGYFGIQDCTETSSRVDIYDVVAHTWSIGELSSKRWCPATATVGSKVFFSGGYSDCFDDFSSAFSAVDIYDASNNSWSHIQLSKPRMGLAMATVGNKVLFAGGYDGSSNPSFFSIVDIYDVSTNTWSTASLSEPRCNLSAVTVGSKVYFAGGNTDIFPNTWTFTSMSKKIDIYDDATGSWSVSSLDVPRAWMSAIAVNNKIFWAGGGPNSSDPASQQVEIKDINTQTSTIECLFEPKAWPFNAAVQKDNKILFYSGNKFDIYDLNTGSWSIGVSPPFPTSSIISLNNALYVIIWDLNGPGLTTVLKLEF